MVKLATEKNHALVSDKVTVRGLFIAHWLSLVKHVQLNLAITDPRITEIRLQCV